MREKEDRWGHSDPGVDSDGFKGQDDPGQWMPRAEAEGKGSGPQRYVWSLFSFSFLFLKSKAFMWIGGKDASFSFTSFQSFQDLMSTCSKPDIYLRFMTPLPPKCPVREGCNVPMLRKREHREVNLHNISWLMCDCRTPSEEPVLSGPCSFHYIILPALSLQWEIIGLSENISASGNQRKKTRKLAVQLILERHRFELCRPTHTWLWKNRYSQCKFSSLWF